LEEQLERSDSDLPSGKVRILHTRLEGLRLISEGIESGEEEKKHWDSLVTGIRLGNVILV